jgi:CHASE2 domain-containing sensor protein
MKPRAIRRPPKTHKARARTRRQRFRSIARALPLVAVAALLTLVLDTVGGMRKIETATLDLQFSLLRGTRQSPVALVLIPRDQLRATFGGTSLTAAALNELLERIAATRPRAIVVALDTSDPSFAAIRAPAGCPIIWSRGGEYSPRRGSFVTRPPAGGAHRQVVSGVAVQRVDNDKVVRRYEQVVQTDVGPQPTLSWAAVCAVTGKHPLRDADPRNEFFLRWNAYAERFHPTAAAVLAMTADAPANEGNLLSGAIVVVGGDWNVSDEHRTPVGWRLGSEIVAQAIETELAGRRIAPLSLPLLLLLQITQGVLLLLLFEVVSFRRALLISIVVVPLLSFGLSLLFFSTLSHWATFAPILLVLIAQRAHERIKETQQKLVATAEENLRTVQS